MSANLPKPFRDALDERARQALACWGVTDQKPELLKYRENAVFRVHLADGRPAALRLHRAGYHSAEALHSELLWMAALNNGGLAVPQPISTEDGRLLVALPAEGEFGTQHADVINWMDGEPLGESGKPLSLAPQRLVRIFSELGASMAEMHNLADRWTPPDGFWRAAWDGEGLLGSRPLWGRFWDCAVLPPAQATALSALRHDLRQHLATLPTPAKDFGLIHADLVRENVLVDERGVTFIDFDDAGHGFRLFDIATALLKNRREPAYETIAAALIAGYRSRRALTDAALSSLPLFLVLRSLTYIGWFAARPELPGSGERVLRYADETLALANELGFT
ncbi:MULTISPECIES: homoserine kinase [unclassified Ensifer]|uniref:phosphotransferase enzyme family protein n=1 Tax=unclassified Ensifer TaxID=2633371 RepID=UPI00081324F8|nr:MULTISPECIES: homoserine kinase [unclassified Ensifer]OCP00522.1 homoserine kinase [Ensifer sp. LC14]OCP05891.1 homoserine kinase [Ensifer sp. LC11]OCP06641.1 homoserine kinase [Ensifer sp. LC13]OCP31119.1 homoserine kinase [Ensifer sp. LC499]